MFRPLSLGLIPGDVFGNGWYRLVPGAGEMVPNVPAAISPDPGPGRFIPCGG